MKNKRLLDIIGEIDDKHIACAAPEAKKSRKRVWMKWGTISACLALALIVATTILLKLGQSGITLQNNPDSTIPTSDNQSGIIVENSPPSPSIDISDISTGKLDGRIDAMYDYGYTSVEELLEVTTLIVRATPIAVEYESAIGLCWVLRIEEADKEGVDVILLRQLKDEHLLKAGQEVVLALQKDEDVGDYYIPGGGCGLFRINEGTNEMSGMLLESLKEHSAVTAELTLSDVFNILTDMKSK